MNNTKSRSGIEIREEYMGYSPQVDATDAIIELIDHIPRKYLTGLKYISLTNFSGQPRKRYREKTKARKRKVKIADSYGLYNGNSKGQTNKAWIEIFVDNILNEWPPELLKNPFFNDFILGNTLYHEIGHHIHRTICPWRRKEPEDIADEWRDKFTMSFIKEKYGAEKMKIYLNETCRLLEKKFGKEKLEEMAKSENYKLNITKI